MCEREKERERYAIHFFHLDKTILCLEKNCQFNDQNTFVI